MHVCHQNTLKRHKNSLNHLKSWPLCVQFAPHSIITQWVTVWVTYEWNTMIFMQNLHLFFISRNRVFGGGESPFFNNSRIWVWFLKKWCLWRQNSVVTPLLVYTTLFLHQKMHLWLVEKVIIFLNLDKCLVKMTEKWQFLHRKNEGKLIQRG